MNLKDNNDMKKTLYSIFALLILFVVAFSNQSCSGDAQKYTVWTDTESYADFVESTNTTITDECYIKIEIGSKTWAEISKDFPSENRHRWNEATIKKWLIGNGFGERESTKESSWLALVDHGMIIKRSGNILNVIVK